MKKFRFLPLVCALTLGLTACGEKEVIEDNTQDTESNDVAELPAQLEDLTVGVMGAVPALPIIVAEEKGFFEARGLEVDLQIFKSPMDRDAALQAGELEGIMTDEVAVAMYQNAGMDVKITGHTDGSFTLVTAPESSINTIEDIVGKTVGISENSAIEFTLDTMLENNGIALDAVERVAIPAIPVRLEMLLAGELDAAILPNPFSDAAIAGGGKEVLVEDSETGTFLSVTTFTQETLDNKKDSVYEFYLAYNDAVAYINSVEVAEIEDIVIANLGYPEAMRGNIVLPTYRTYSMPSYEEVEKVLAWSSEKGLVSDTITVEDMTYDLGIYPQ